MTTIHVQASYYASTSGTVNLPQGKTWEDVAHWYVKWDTLYLRFKGDDEEYAQIDLDSCVGDIIDWKRPTGVSIYGTDDDGETDYEVELAEL